MKKPMNSDVKQIFKHATAVITRAGKVNGWYIWGRALPVGGTHLWILPKSITLITYGSRPILISQASFLCCFSMVGHDQALDTLFDWVRSKRTQVPAHLVPACTRCLTLKTPFNHISLVSQPGLALGIRQDEAHKISLKDGEHFTAWRAVFHSACALESFMELEIGSGGYWGWDPVSGNSLKSSISNFDAQPSMETTDKV